MNISECRGAFYSRWGNRLASLGTTAQTLLKSPPMAHFSRLKFSGGVAERLIAPVLKTGRPKGLVSSNLTPSAIQILRLTHPSGVCYERARSRCPTFQRIFGPD